jgi:hypothetical protein
MLAAGLIVPIFGLRLPKFHKLMHVKTDAWSGG